MRVTSVFLEKSSLYLCLRPVKVDKNDFSRQITKKMWYKLTLNVII